MTCRTPLKRTQSPPGPYIRVPRGEGPSDASAASVIQALFLHAGRLLIKIASEVERERERERGSMAHVQTLDCAHMDSGSRATADSSRLLQTMYKLSTVHTWTVQAEQQQIAGDGCRHLTSFDRHSFLLCFLVCNRPEISSGFQRHS